MQTTVTPQYLISDSSLVVWILLLIIAVILLNPASNITFIRRHFTLLTSHTPKTLVALTLQLLDLCFSSSASLVSPLLCRNSKQFLHPGQSRSRLQTRAACHQDPASEMVSQQTSDETSATV